MAKRIEMGGIYGPLQQRLRLMKRRDHLEKTENSVCLPCGPAYWRISRFVPRSYIYRNIPDPI